MCSRRGCPRIYCFEPMLDDNSLQLRIAVISSYVKPLMESAFACQILRRLWLPVSEATKANKNVPSANVVHY